MCTPWLSIVTITKDDPIGLARTVASTTAYRAEGGVEQVVIFAGECIPDFAGERLDVRRQCSKGIAEAFNEGLAVTQGEWIWFLNGGDAAHEALDVGWLKSLLRRTSSDLVIGGLVYDQDGAMRSPPPVCELWPLYRPWIPHPSTIVRREQFVVHGAFDPKLSIAMDYEWWMRALTAGARADTIALPLARFAPGGLSQREELKSRRVHECRSALFRHQRGLWRSLLLQNARLARASLRALFGVLFSRGRY